MEPVVVALEFLPTGFTRTAVCKRTPAMAQGLSDHVWTVAEYVSYPVHVGACQRLIWAEEREKLITSPLFHEEP